MQVFNYLLEKKIFNNFYSLILRFSFEKKHALFLRIYYGVVLLVCTGLGISSDLLRPHTKPNYWFIFFKNN